MKSPHGRNGTVLALAVLVLVALQVLAHGALVMARAERAASLAGLHVFQARVGADAGAMVAVEAPKVGWDSIGPFGVTPTVTGSLRGHPFSGRMERLSREYWFPEGHGRSRGQAWGMTIRYLVWLLDPFGRVMAAKGAAEVGGALPPTAAVDFDPDRPALCLPWQAAVDSLLSPAVWSRAVSIPPSGVGEPSLGLLGARELASILPVLSATYGTPTPASWLGRCDGTVAWNWGDPLSPGNPCGNRVVALSSLGHLVLQDGVGQGLLSVNGDLTLRGTRFDGVVLVGGSLALEDDAEVRGMVRVGGDLKVATGSRIRGSPCRALRALEAFRSPLQRPVRLRGAGIVEESD